MDCLPDIVAWADATADFISFRTRNMRRTRRMRMILNAMPWERSTSMPNVDESASTRVR